MLPDIRAAVAAVIVAIALLAVSFGVAATLRVAQDSRAGSLHADLAQRGRAFAASAPSVIETPAPLQPIPVAAIETRDILEPAAPVAAVPVDVLPLNDLALRAADEAEPAPVAVSARAEATPAAEPPVGGPLEPVTQVAALPPPEAAPSTRNSATEKARAAQKAAAAKKARAARLARERRVAAARRAAQARQAQQNAAQPYGSFNSNFGNNSFRGFGSTPPQTQ